MTPCHGCTHLRTNDGAVPPSNLMCDHPKVMERVKTSPVEALEFLLSNKPHITAAEFIGCVMAPMEERPSGQENLWPIAYRMGDVLSCEQREEPHESTDGPVHE